MAAALCFEAAESSDGGEVEWQRLADPPYLVERSGTVTVELPSARKRYPKAFVNGLAVVGGVHVVQPGDLVRIVIGKDEEVSYVVGRLVPSVEPGEHRRCAFTGLPIAGQAIRCPCGLLVAEEVASQVGRCPCGRVLSREASARDWPAEELL